jgi:hypothetical protein
LDGGVGTVSATPEEEFTWQEVTVVCHTEGCGNKDYVITLLTLTGSPVACGPCGVDCEVLTRIGPPPPNY